MLTIQECVACLCPVAPFIKAGHLSLRGWISIVCLPHPYHYHLAAISCLQGKGQLRVNERKWVYNWSAQSGHAFPAPAVKLAPTPRETSHDSHAVGSRAVFTRNMVSSCHIRTFEVWCKELDKLFGVFLNWILLDELFSVFFFPELLWSESNP